MTLPTEKAQEYRNYRAGCAKRISVRGGKDGYSQGAFNTWVKWIGVKWDGPTQEQWPPGPAALQSLWSPLGSGLLSGPLCHSYELHLLCLLSRMFSLPTPKFNPHVFAQLTVSLGLSFNRTCSRKASLAPVTPAPHSAPAFQAVDCQHMFTSLGPMPPGVPGTQKILSKYLSHKWMNGNE